MNSRMFCPLDTLNSAMISLPHLLGVSCTSSAVAGSAGSSTERMRATVDAKDSSPNPGDAVNRYKEALAQTDYFRTNLSKANGVRLAALATSPLPVHATIFPSPRYRTVAERFGMTHFVNPKEVGNDLVPHLVNMTKQGADQIGGADYTFDCTGNTVVMRQALECTHKGWGRSIIIGVAPSGAEISTRPFQLVSGRRWMGTAFGGARGRTDVPKIVDWYMDGRINIDDLITHTLPLSEINKGFDLMHAGESIRSVVLF